MARYTGADCRRCRREKMKLFLKGSKCESPKCPIEIRPYPPGEHGRGRTKDSEYLLQMREKQKCARIYGVLEKQFRGYYEEANKKTGKTGENLLVILESRLDNVVYRAGFAKSRDARLVFGHDQCRHRGDRTRRIDESISSQVGEHRHGRGQTGQEVSDRLWRMLQGSGLARQGGHHSLGVPAEQTDEEAVRMKDLDPVRRCTLVGKVLQIEGHDGVGTTADGGGEHMPVLGIARHLVDEVIKLLNKRLGAEGFPHHSDTTARIFR